MDKITDKTKDALIALSTALEDLEPDTARQVLEDTKDFVMALVSEHASKGKKSYSLEEMYERCGLES